MKRPPDIRTKLVPVLVLLFLVDRSEGQPSAGFTSSYAPAEGPYSAVTLVTFTLRCSFVAILQSWADNAQSSHSILCSFGDQVVDSGVAVQPTASVQTFTCLAPRAAQPGSVALRVSIDGGAHFYEQGQFTYQPGASYAGAQAPATPPADALQATSEQGISSLPHSAQFIAAVPAPAPAPLDSSAIPQPGSQQGTAAAAPGLPPVPADAATAAVLISIPAFDAPLASPPDAAAMPAGPTQPPAYGGAFASPFAAPAAAPAQAAGAPSMESALTSLDASAGAPAPMALAPLPEFLPASNATAGTPTPMPEAPAFTDNSGSTAPSPAAPPTAEQPAPSPDQPPPMALPAVPGPANGSPVADAFAQLASAFQLSGVSGTYPQGSTISFSVAPQPPLNASQLITPTAASFLVTAFATVQNMSLPITLQPGNTNATELEGSFSLPQGALGDMQLEVLLGGQQIAGSPASFSVIGELSPQPPQEPSGTWTVTSGAYNGSVFVGLAGQPMVLLVTPEAPLQPLPALDVSLYNTDNAASQQLQCTPVPELPDHCTVEISTTTAGGYKLAILQHGQHIACAAANSACSGPFAVVIAPLQPVASLSYMAAPAGSTVEAGTSLSLAVYARDEFGNAAAAAAVSVQLQCGASDPIFAVITQDAQVVIASAQPTLVCQYTLSAFLDGLPLNASHGGAVTLLTVVPGPPSALNTRLYGSGTLAQATAGQALGVQAILQDAYGNPITDPAVAAASPLSLEVQGAGQDQLFALSLDPSAWDLRLFTAVTLFAAGQYSLTATLNNATAARWIVTVVAAAADIPSTSITVLTPSLAAGSTAVFKLRLQDAWGNTATAGSPLDSSGSKLIGPQTLDATSGALSIAAAPDPDGLYDLTAEPTVAGTYSLALVLGGTAVGPQLSAPSMQVLPGRLSSASSTASGSGLSGGQAGNVLAFTIAPQDAFGNAYTSLDIAASANITLASGSGNSFTSSSLQPTITLRTDGTLLVQYASTQVGDVALTVALNSQPISGSPFQGTITPAAASAARSAISGPDTSSCIAGMQCLLYIAAADAFGNLRTDGTDVFVVSGDVPGLSNTVQRLKDGSGLYQVVYSLPALQKGFLSLRIQLLTPDGPQDVGTQSGGLFSPLAIAIAPAAAVIRAANCQAAGPGLSGSMAGVPGVIIITARDSQGVRQSAGDANFLLEITTTGGQVLPASAIAYSQTFAAADGTYSLTYTIQQAGSYVASAYLNSKSPANLLGTASSPDPGSLPFPASIAILPGPTSPATSAFTVGADRWVAGAAVAAVIAPRDAFGNPQRHSGGLAPDVFTVTAALGSQQVPFAAAWDAAAGIFNVTGKLLAAGTYTLLAMLGSAQLPAISISVLPAALSLNTTSASGQALATATAGTTTNFTILPQDAYGNPIPAANIACSLTVVKADQTASVLQTACQPDPLVGTRLQAAYYIPQAGAYILNITLADNAASGTASSAASRQLLGSFPLTVLPGGVSLDKTRIAGFMPGVPTRVFAGIRRERFPILTTDALGNVVKVDCSSFKALLTGPPATQTPARVITLSDGSCSLTINQGTSSIIQSPGAYSLDVMFGVSPAPGSPFAIAADPPPTDASQTCALNADSTKLVPCAQPANCSSMLQGVAGLPSNFTIVALTPSGSRQSSLTDTFAVSVVPQQRRSLLQTSGAPTTGEQISGFLSNGGGSYTVQWTAQAAGALGAPLTYRIDVVLTTSGQNQTIFGSPFFGQLSPGPVAPAASSLQSVDCTSYGAMLPDNALSTCLLLQTEDAFGNSGLVSGAAPSIAVSPVASPISDSLELSLQQLQDSAGDPLMQYIVIASSPTAGNYGIAMSINGQPVGEPVQTIISPGEIDLQQSTIAIVNQQTGPGSTAGEPLVVEIMAADTFGNPLNMTAYLEGQSSEFSIAFGLQLRQGSAASYRTITDFAAIAGLGLAANGTQRVTGDAIIGQRTDLTFTPVLGGSLTISANLTIGSSSYAYQTVVLVSAAAVDLARTQVAGPGWVTAAAGQVAEFQVTAMDAYGNVKAGECQSFSVSADFVAALPLNITSSPDNTTCIVAYAAAMPGQHSLQVMYQGAMAASSALTVVHVLGPLDPSQSVMWPPQMLPFVTAGSSARRRVMLADSSGTALGGSAGDVVVAHVTGPANVTVDVLDNLDGSYSLSYTLQQAGSYQVTIAVNGTTISDAAPVTCLPAAIDWTASAVTVTPVAVVAAANATITVVPQDLYGNLQTPAANAAITLAARIGRASIPLALVNGAFTGNVSLAAVGTYSFSLLLGGTSGAGKVQLPGSYSLTVVEGPPYVPATQMRGEGATRAQAGITTSLYLSLFDIGGNPVLNATAYLATQLSAALHPIPQPANDTRQDVPVSLTYTPEQHTLLGRYTPKFPGLYSLQLSVGGAAAAVAGGYGAIAVGPGPVAAGNCVAVGVSGTVLAGNLTTSISVQDALGNAVSSDPQAAFTITFVGSGILQGVYIPVSSSQLSWTGSAYQTTIPVTAAGSYSVQVRRGLDDIAGSPYTLGVLPGPTAAANCTVSGLGWSQAAAGVPETVVVQAADVYSNSRTDSLDRFLLQVNSSAESTALLLPMLPLGNGQYTANYTLTTPTSAQLAVLYNSPQGITQMVAAADATVFPGPVSPASSSLRLMPSSRVIPSSNGSHFSIPVGLAAALELVPRDSFGNRLAQDQAAALRFSIDITPADPLTTTSSASPMAMRLPMQVQSDGTFTCLFQLTAAATYTITALYTPLLGPSLPSATLQLDVTPAVPAVNTSRIVGLRQQYTATASGSFTLSLKDAFGNPANVVADSLSGMLQILVFPDAYAAPVITSPVVVPFTLGSFSSAAGVIVQFQPSVTGSLKILCTINGQLILDELTGRVPVASVVAGPPASVAFMAAAAAASFVNGTRNSLLFRVKDANGNVLPAPSGASLSVAANPPLAGPATVSVSPAGLCKASFLPSITAIPRPSAPAPSSTSSTPTRGLLASSGGAETLEANPAGVGRALLSGDSASGDANAVANLTLSISYDGAVLASASLKVASSVGAIDPSKTTVQELASGLGFGAGVPSAAGQVLSGRAGSTLTFLIRTFDTNGVALPTGSSSSAANFAVAVAPSDTNSRTALASNQDGTYTLTFSATIAISHYLTLAYSGQVISTLAVQITPAASDAAQSGLVKPDGSPVFGSGAANATAAAPAPLAAAAGEPLVVFLAAYDTYGNVQSQANGDMSAVSASLEAAPGQLPVACDVTLADSRQALLYRLACTAQVAGIYSLLISMDSVPVGSLPSYPVTVPHGALSPANTIMASPLAAATAGQPSSFMFQVYDQFGNPYTAGDVWFGMRATHMEAGVSVMGHIALASTPTTPSAAVGGPSSAPPMGLAAATYSATFTATLAGNYSVTVFQLTAPAATSATAAARPAAAGTSGQTSTTPADSGSATGGLSILQLLQLNVTVAAAAVDALASSASGAGLQVATAGLQSSFSVIPKDAFGNLVLTLPQIDFAGGIAVASSSISADSIAVQYTPQTATPLILYLQYPGPGGKPQLVGNQTYNIAITPADPPQLVSAQLQPSLVAVVVDFDQATNQAGMGAAVSSCTPLLADLTIAKLGTSPTCQFTSPSTLLINLGSDATLSTQGTVLPDSLELRPNAIGTAGSNSYNASGSVLVDLPSAVPLLTPTPVLLAPSQVSVCDSVIIDACQSTGSGGRLLTFTFTLRSTAILSPALAARLPRKSPSCSFTVLPGELTPGVTYHIVAEVRNFLSQAATADAYMAVQTGPVPTVVIAGGSRTIHQAEGLLLPGRITLSGSMVWDPASKACVANSGASTAATAGSGSGGSGLSPYTFLWTADPSSPAPFDFASLPAAYQPSRNSRELAIPPNVLQAGLSYVFRLTATPMASAADAAAGSGQGSAQSSAAGVASSAAVAVTIAYMPIGVSILGGNRVVSQANGLTLQAVGRDPDNTVDANGTPYPFLYTWTLVMPSGRAQPAAVAGRLFGASAVQRGLLVLGPGELSAGIHTFIVSAIKEPLTALRAPTTAAVTITVTTAASIPTSVYLAGADAAAVLPSLPLQLQCVVPGDSNSLSYQWAATSSLGAVDITTLSSNPTVASLAIRPGSLVPAVQYTFTCTTAASSAGTSAASAAAGQASLALQAVDWPTAGTLAVQLAAGSSTLAAEGYDGVEAIDEFYLLSTGWAGMSTSQLEYEFRYITEPPQSLPSVPAGPPPTTNQPGGASSGGTARTGADSSSSTGSSEGTSTAAASAAGSSTAAAFVELPLAAPSTANWLRTRLPAGRITAVVYVRYAGSARSSPLGIPAGARLESPPLNIQPLSALSVASSASSAAREPAALPAAGDLVLDQTPITSSPSGRRRVLADDLAAAFKQEGRAGQYPASLDSLGATPDLAGMAQSIQRIASSGRILQQAADSPPAPPGAHLQALLQRVAAEGDVYNALVLAAALGRSTAVAAASASVLDPTAGAQNSSTVSVVACQPTARTSAALTEQVLAVLINLDASTFASPQYLLQASCALASLPAAGLTPASAQLLSSFYAPHLASLASSRSGLSIAPLRSGDPFACFAAGLGNTLASLAPACQPALVADNSTLAAANVSNSSVGDGTSSRISSATGTAPSSNAAGGSAGSSGAATVVGSDGSAANATTLSAAAGAAPGLSQASLNAIEAVLRSAVNLGFGIAASQQGTSGFANTQASPFQAVYDLSALKLAVVLSGTRLTASLGQVNVSTVPLSAQTPGPAPAATAAPEPTAAALSGVPGSSGQQDAVSSAEGASGSGSGSSAGSEQIPSQGSVDADSSLATAVADAPSMLVAQGLLTGPNTAVVTSVDGIHPPDATDRLSAIVGIFTSVPSSGMLTFDLPVELHDNAALELRRWDGTFSSAPKRRRLLGAGPDGSVQRSGNTVTVEVASLNGYFFIGGNSGFKPRDAAKGGGLGTGPARAAALGLIITAAVLGGAVLMALTWLAVGRYRQRQSELIFPRPPGTTATPSAAAYAVLRQTHLDGVTTTAGLLAGAGRFASETTSHQLTNPLFKGVEVGTRRAASASPMAHYTPEKPKATAPARSSPVKPSPLSMTAAPGSFSEAFNRRLEEASNAEEEEDLVSVPAHFGTPPRHPASRHARAKSAAPTAGRSFTASSPTGPSQNTHAGPKGLLGQTNSAAVHQPGLAVMQSVASCSAVPAAETWALIRVDGAKDDAVVDIGQLDADGAASTSLVSTVPASPQVPSPSVKRLAPADHRSASAAVSTKVPASQLPASASASEQGPATHKAASLFRCKQAPASPAGRLSPSKHIRSASASPLARPPTFDDNH